MNSEEMINEEKEKMIENDNENSAVPPGGTESVNEEIKINADAIPSADEPDEKIAGLEAVIKKLENELNTANDKFLRKVAEFDNYKRRMEQEQSNLVKYSSEGFISKILPVVDDLERSLKFTKESDSANTVREGVQLIFDKFLKVLNEQGIRKIESIGQHFDVHLHEAVMMMPREGVEPLTIIEEIESGYYFKDKVLRHGKVIVAAAPEDGENAASDTENKE
ncbi:MAG: nucleotide exchange factor GrpE [Ignavibacteriaceae bacterium]|nr:nucleotide exchange factor GrpE [Ignavibacteriaceae bacterium]